MGRWKRHGQHDRRETPETRDAPADAPDAGISKIVHFGDSLTGGGALFAPTGAVLTLPFPLADFGYSTQITSGLNHADVTPDLLCAETANDAFGRARAVGTRSLASAVASAVAEAYLVEDADPDIPGQDISPGGEPAPAGMAASILIGLNDFNTSPPTDPATIVAEATLSAGAAALAQAGVETLIINTLPPPGVFPRFKCADPAVQAAGDVIVSSCNDALAAQAAQLEALGVEVRVIDLGDRLAEADIRGFA